MGNVGLGGWQAQIKQEAFRLDGTPPDEKD